MPEHAAVNPVCVLVQTPNLLNLCHITFIQRLVVDVLPEDLLAEVVVLPNEMETINRQHDVHNQTVHSNLLTVQRATFPPSANS